MKRCLYCGKPKEYGGTDSEICACSSIELNHIMGTQIVRPDIKPPQHAQLKELLIQVVTYDRNLPVDASSEALEQRLQAARDEYLTNPLTYNIVNHAVAKVLDILK